ncbi:hypothetical protein [Microbacterium sp. BK668]|uniref:hypothetical protein n=1 Tax=Microbacterium sp. BK668 TaxID=2512118 RepID=UPI001060820E|nr:hypothetical protein [Microbacterium sp. BK668]TDN92301.1 hypothetical protein EV279_1820 [Microbacterium sp. BK668]
MSHFHRRRWGAAAIAAAAVFSVAAPVSAHAETFEIPFPAGQACDFDIVVTGSTGNTVYREFSDRDGDVVRTLLAGTGAALTLTNVETGTSVSLKSNGAVSMATVNPDGTTTLRSTGHNVILLSPSDVPAGPSTTLYVGRVTYDVGAGNVFTIVGSSGQTRDLCAELE